jgi:transposase-like protein
MDSPRTLLDAVSYFKNADNCLEYLKARRWPNGVVSCPTCGNTHVRFDQKRRVWTCNTKHARRQFSIKVGTIFEDSPLGLDKWLPTVWMIVNCKNGVSSWEIHRAIGVTQKTAWFMLQRIRLAMQDSDTGGKLSGDVELDETFIGGKARNMHFKQRERLGITKGASMAGKVAVMGLLERHPEKGSRVRLATIANNKRKNLMPHVTAHVEKGATVHTDSLSSYVSLDTDYAHHVIDHAEKYVDGQVHTNGLENFWSLLKRAIKGTYVSVQPFHLFRYLDEQAFRFNNRRDMNDADRFSAVICNIVGRRLTYKDLIAAINGVSPA